MSQTPYEILIIILVLFLFIVLIYIVLLISSKLTIFFKQII
jgi:hypothetical protein